MKILFIQTGGTIDKDYPQAIGGYSFEITSPAVERMLLQVNPVFDYEVFPLLQKDSQDLTDQDREFIRQACVSAEERVIIITHGTDTMLETARALGQVPDKIIILTGATKPERFVGSDALANLGLALGAASFCEQGVYVAMNGHVLAADRCQRDMETGQFIAT